MVKIVITLNIPKLVICDALKFHNICNISKYHVVKPKPPPFQFMFVKRFAVNFFMTVLGIFLIDLRYSRLGTMVLWEILEHDLRI